MLLLCLLHPATRWRAHGGILHLPSLGILEFATIPSPYDFLSVGVPSDTKVKKERSLRKKERGRVEKVRRVA